MVDFPPISDLFPEMLDFHGFPIGLCVKIWYHLIGWFCSLFLSKIAIGGAVEVINGYRYCTDLNNKLGYYNYSSAPPSIPYPHRLGNSKMTTSAWPRVSSISPRDNLVIPRTAQGEGSCRWRHKGLSVDGGPDGGPIPPFDRWVSWEKWPP